MLAEFAGLLQNVDVFLAQRRFRIAAIVAIDQLRKTQRAGEASGAAANNGYVRFHLRTLNTFKRFAESDHLALSISIQQKNLTAKDAMVAKQIRNFLVLSGLGALCGESYPPALAFFTSSVRAGRMSNRFPTTPKSAISKIGASASLLMAMMLREPFIPTMC